MNDDDTDGPPEEPNISRPDEVPGGPTWDLPVKVGSPFYIDPLLESTLPDRFGRYQVRARLGQGGFGEVYRGWDPQLDRDVAIKVLRSDRVPSPDHFADFLIEARTTGKLEQSGIVSIYDVGLEADRCYIVERFIDGPTLAARLAEGLPDRDEAIRIVVRIAEVLHGAHAKGWVHRDIKPANILLEKKVEPYLADFGLAMQLEVMRGKDSGFAGTPRYMAPEVIAQALGTPEIGHRQRLPRPDHRCDIYSLGVILYEMLTGRPPYQAATREELLAMIDRAEPTPPRLLNPAIPAALEEICLKAIAYDPATRYRTAADLAEDLKRLGKVDIAATGPTPAPRTTTQLPWAWIAVGAAIAVVAIILIVPILKPGVPETTRAPEVPRPPVATPAIDHAELKRMLRALREEMDEKHQQRQTSLPAAARPKAETKPEDLELPVPFRAEFEGPLREAREKGDEPKEFSLLLKATNDLISAGHPGPARALAQRMVEVSGKDEAKLPIAYGQLGLAEYKLGWAEDAIASYEQSNRTYEKYYEKLLKAPAVPQVLKMRSSMARLLGISLNRIGNANKALDRSKNARAAYEQAITLLEPYKDRTSELSMALMNLGSLESTAGEHDAAARALERALSLARADQSTVDVCDILINLGNARSRAGDEEASLAAYKEAYESMPPKAPYESRASVLTNWIQSLVFLERLEEARKLLPELRRIVRPDDQEANRAIALLEPIIEGGRSIPP